MKSVADEPRATDIPAAPDAASALGNAALVALHAPSVHNTQPWHWRVGGDRLELYADERWQLQIADPGGRLLLLSCGAALHQVRVALRGMGYLPAVRRLRERDQLGRLATVTVDRPIPVTEHATELLLAALHRQTDRRSFADVRIPDEALTAMRQAAASEGVWLQVLNPDQVTTLLTAAEHAEATESADRRNRQELTHWTGHPPGAPDGIPVTALPPRGSPYRPNDTYAILYGNGDRPVSWLHAGEALSAVWLAALVHGLAVQPISAVIEVPGARATIYRMLSGIGSPYLALRIGVPAANGTELADEVSMTGRRAASEVLEAT
ncbi:MAG: nitroreductase [Micromonosporaceae bacterium]